MEPHEATEPQHEKPMLTVEEQIAHLKEKGVKFELCSENDAAAYLTEKCNFFRAAAYRKLFDKHVGGDKDGQYVDLDFDQLRFLADLDCQLRDVLLPMSLDVEHFAKVALLDTVEENAALLPKANPARSSLDFVKTLTIGFGVLD